MILIITKQNPDGTYDDVGMSNMTLLHEYKSVATAWKYCISKWEKGMYRIEVYGEQTSFGRSFQTIYKELK